MAIQMMTSLLDEINRQASAAQKPAIFSTPKSDEGRPLFSNLLINSINTMDTMQHQASNQAEDYMTGASGIGLNDVMVSMQKASLGLNFGIQVRNKLVSAYQEIMNMAV